ncbi:MAG: hypothetical protein VW600_04715, partial [Ferrovibrio sp.]
VVKARPQLLHDKSADGACITSEWQSGQRRISARVPVIIYPRKTPAFRALASFAIGGAIFHRNTSNAGKIQVF